MVPTIPVDLLLLRVLLATPQQREAIARLVGWKPEHGVESADEWTHPPDASPGSSLCAEACADWLKELRSMAQTVEGLDRKLGNLERGLEEVTRENGALRQAKLRLEQMQSEKLFGFTHQIDPRSFRILCAILAHGNVSRASRALALPDSTVRKWVAGWKRRGPLYHLLTDMVRWRKAMGRRQIVPLNEAITRGTSATTDLEGLLADVLDGLLELNHENWEQRADALVELLRPYVAR